VPYGKLYNVRMSNVTLNGDGNFRNIVINGDAGNIVVGDTILQLALNLKTTIGNDSVGFNITSSSPGTYGTATLNGGAVALGDSLYVSMLPSEIFLNQNRWEIAGGSEVIIRTH